MVNENWSIVVMKWGALCSAIDIEERKDKGIERDKI